MIYGYFIAKAELPQEVILFRTQFPSLGIFINKKSWILEILRTPSHGGLYRDLHDLVNNF
jgi:hypothetical protein